jgi:hypothetical protein
LYLSLTQYFLEKYRCVSNGKIKTFVALGAITEFFIPGEGESASGFDWVTASRKVGDLRLRPMQGCVSIS